MSRAPDLRALKDAAYAQALRDRDEGYWSELGPEEKVEQLNRRLALVEAMPPIRHWGYVTKSFGAVLLAIITVLATDYARGMASRRVAEAAPPVWRGGASTAPDRVSKPDSGQPSSLREP